MTFGRSVEMAAQGDRPQRAVHGNEQVERVDLGKHRTQGCLYACECARPSDGGFAVHDEHAVNAAERFPDAGEKFPGVQERRWSGGIGHCH